MSDIDDDEKPHMDVVLPDTDSVLRAEGWRLHVFCEHEGGNVYIASERVLPEKVGDPTAHNVFDSRRILMHPDEIAWLRDRLTELLS